MCLCIERRACNSPFEMLFNFGSKPLQYRLLRARRQVSSMPNVELWHAYARMNYLSTVSGLST